jgi:hypothetical protein
LLFIITELKFEREAVNMRKVREGMIPTVLGTAVTATGLAVRTVAPAVGWGVAGFGLAHIVLGAIDLFEHRSRQ